MCIEIAAKADRGRVRDRNEDSYLVTEFEQTTSICDASIRAVTGHSTHHEATMMLVADGSLRRLQFRDFRLRHSGFAGAWSFISSPF